MTRDEVLRAYEQLSAEDQQAVREAISERAADRCCDTTELQKHMGAMMRMMKSSASPMDHCKQMMEMCQKMMEQKQGPVSTGASRQA